MTDLVTTNRPSLVFDLPKSLNHSQKFGNLPEPTGVEHDPLASVFQHGDIDLQVGCLPAPFQQQ